MSEVNSFHFPLQADVENRQTDNKFADTSERISISIPNSLKINSVGLVFHHFFRLIHRIMHT